MKKSHEQLGVLINLQDCDNRITDIKSQKKEGPIKIQGLKDSLAIMEKQLDDDLNQFEAHKRERRQAEQEIEDLETQIEKSNIKLSSIRSNKEYKAGLKEISGLEKEKQHLEDKVIEMMEKIEALEEKNLADKAKRTELREKFEKDHDAILKALSALDQDLGGLGKERISLCRAIDENLLKKYDYLREHTGGLGISSVIKGVCQACHMGIPPQKFNELIRGDNKMTCPNCKRIIYWGEDERFNNAFKNV